MAMKSQVWPDPELAPDLLQTSQRCSIKWCQPDSQCDSRIKYGVFLYYEIWSRFIQIGDERRPRRSMTSDLCPAIGKHWNADENTSHMGVSQNDLPGVTWLAVAKLWRRLTHFAQPTTKVAPLLQYPFTLFKTFWFRKLECTMPG